MGDEVYSLFVVVAALTTLAMPTIAQPMFAVLAATLAVLAHRAAAYGGPDRSRSSEHVRRH